MHFHSRCHWGEFGHVFCIRVGGLHHIRESLERNVQIFFCDILNCLAHIDLWGLIISQNSLRIKILLAKRDLLRLVSSMLDVSVVKILSKNY